MNTTDPAGYESVPHDLIEEAAEAARRPPATPAPGPLGRTNAAIQNYATRALGRAAAAAVAKEGEVTEDGVRLPE